MAVSLEMMGLSTAKVLGAVFQVVLRAGIFLIGVAAAVKPIKEAAALAGAVVTGELSGSAVAAGVGAAGLLTAALSAKRHFDKRGQPGGETATGGTHKRTQIDMVGPETREATKSLAEILLKLVACVESDDLDATSALAEDLVECAAELKAAVDERMLLQENAKKSLQSLQPPSARTSSLLLLPNDERADILKRIPHEVRIGFANMPGGLGKADVTFMAQAAAGCRQFLLHKGLAVLALCSTGYRPAIVWRLKIEQSVEFARLLAHLLQRSLPGRSTPGRVAREQELLIEVSYIRGVARRQRLE